MHALQHLTPSPSSDPPDPHEPLVVNVAPSGHCVQWVITDTLKNIPTFLPPLSYVSEALEPLATDPASLTRRLRCCYPALWDLPEHVFIGGQK